LNKTLEQNFYRVQIKLDMVMPLKGNAYWWYSKERKRGRKRE